MPRIEAKCYRGVAGLASFWSRCGPGLLDVHLSPGPEISSRISGATAWSSRLTPSALPSQYHLNPQRCQRATVSGFTMTRTLSQSVQILRNSTQNTRSTFENRSCFTERRRTASCCRRATFSRASLRRAFKAEMRAGTNDKIMPAWCWQTGDWSSSKRADE